MDNLLGKMNRLGMSNSQPNINNILKQMKKLEVSTKIPNNVIGKRVFITKGIHRSKIATIQYEQPATYVVKINMNQTQQFKHIKKNNVSFIKN